MSIRYGRNERHECDVRCISLNQFWVGQDFEDRHRPGRPAMGVQARASQLIGQHAALNINSVVLLFFWLDVFGLGRGSIGGGK